MSAPFGVDGLTVRFGHVTALENVSLRTLPGEVTAIVGGDGAGKSTLLRVLADRVRADSGTISTVDRTRYGYQPATSGVWPTLTVEENVEFVGRSYGMPSASIRSRSAELLERAGLDAARHRLGHALSGGMRQKLGFVLAILHDPELVLLDEPSTGVDPVSRVELWRLISSTVGTAVAGEAVAGEAVAGDAMAGSTTADGHPTTVVMATTYLDEAQRAAHVLALDAGRMLASGTPDEIVAAVPGGIARLDDPSSVLPELADRVWRRGTERRVWMPPQERAQNAYFAHSSGETDAAVTPIASPDFEDALIALTLASTPRTGPALTPRTGPAPAPRTGPA
ncbi:ABC transporter ATP-binding protein, partial [Humibacter antri]